jgi:hypothetical protein
MQKKGGGKKSDAWIRIKIDWQTRNQTFFMSCKALGEIVWRIWRAPFKL